MVMCCICNHYSERKTCKFFRFPKDTKTKEEWLTIIGETRRQITQNSLICSCHFNNGQRWGGIKPCSTGPSTPTVIKSPTKSPEKKRLKHADSTCSNESELVVPSGSRPCSALSLTNKFEGIDLNTSSSSVLDATNYFLEKENVELKSQKFRKMSYEQIQNNDKQIMTFTGIPNSHLFETVYGLFEKLKLIYVSKWTVQQIPKRDQFLLTLMKLRMNLLYEDLAFRFDVSVATVHNIFLTWLLAMHEILYEQLMEKIPSRSKNKLCLPTNFSTFTNCRIILDCTEVSSVKPSSMEKQKLTWSSYKHKNTLKGLIGVAPNGVITYASELYPGSTSDKNIVQHSKILEQMEAGDLILADKGFLIKDLLPPGVNLNLPPFLTTSQFTEGQVLRTQQIAKARIHVERAIRRVKCYKIIDKIPVRMLPHATKIFQVIAALTNMQFPLIAAEEEDI